MGLQQDLRPNAAGGKRGAIVRNRSRAVGKEKRVVVFLYLKKEKKERTTKKNKTENERVRFQTRPCVFFFRTPNERILIANPNAQCPAFSSLQNQADGSRQAERRFMAQGYRCMPISVRAMRVFFSAYPFKMPTDLLILVHPPTYASVHFSVHLFICLSICLSIRLSYSFAHIST